MRSMLAVSGVAVMLALTATTATAQIGANYDGKLYFDERDELILCNTCMKSEGSQVKLTCDGTLTDKKVGTLQWGCNEDCSTCTSSSVDVVLGSQIETSHGGWSKNANSGSSAAAIAASASCCNAMVTSTEYKETTCVTAETVQYAPLGCAFSGSSYSAVSVAECSSSTSDTVALGTCSGPSSQPKVGDSCGIDAHDSGCLTFEYKTGDSGCSEVDFGGLVFTSPSAKIECSRTGEICVRVMSGSRYDSATDAGTDAALPECSGASRTLGFAAAAAAAVLAMF